MSHISTISEISVMSGNYIVLCTYLVDDFIADGLRWENEGSITGMYPSVLYMLRDGMGNNLKEVQHMNVSSNYNDT